MISLEAAAELVPDGASVGIGGVLLRRKPIALLSLLAAQRRELRLYSFLAGLDIDLLIAAGAVAEVHAGYVGFEQWGFAPAYERAVDAGRIRAAEYSEMLFTAGLRASAAGLPFLPTRGARGSDLVAELGFEEVACPYSGERLTAVPAMRPDVCLIHADAADTSGNVALPAVRDFLYDADALLARASGTVIVTVERLVSTDELRGHGALLFSYEVDAVVPAPGGARPGELPGSYPAELEVIRAYLHHGREDPGAAARRLIEASKRR